MTSLEMWLIFLRYADDVKKRDLVNKILDKRGTITVAANVLSSISQDEHMKAKRRSQRKYETDMANNYLVGIDVGRAEGEKKGEAKGIKKGRAEGIKKGKAEGRAEGKAEGRAEGRAEGIFTVAKNMLNEGVSIETIIKVTGLTRREVNQLRKQA